MNEKLYKVEDLGAKAPRASGYGPAFNEVEYLKVGDQEAAFRFHHDASPRPRTGRRPGMDYRYWYTVLGWKADTLRAPDTGAPDAVLERLIAEGDMPRVEAAIKAVKGQDYRIVFFDWPAVSP